jgi:N-acetyl-gamma-glutamyl-phosphate reductase common form
MPADRAAAPEAVPTVVFGGHGYAAGELLRILAGHPGLRIAAVASSSQAGKSVVEAFPHLAGLGLEPLRFVSLDEAAYVVGGARGRVAAFFATPHGATAPLVRTTLAAAEKGGADLRCVDLSADFRFPDAASFKTVYGKDHGAPELLGRFVCDVPELWRGPTPRHAAQPGCFTTCAVLSAAPFVAAGLVEPDVFVSAVTGSSGSGSTPAANTHHPERRSNLYAYSPLAHRHEPEMRALLSRAAGAAVGVDFAPHSGPFVRGIHATLRMTLRKDFDADALAAEAARFYAAAPFVRVSVEAPKLTEIAGTNRMRIGVAARGRTLVVAGVLDNLVKGAAGGAVQWMNRLFGFDEDAGLRLAGLGWM